MKQELACCVIAGVSVTSGCAAAQPNLIARGLDMEWTADTHTVSAYVVNDGSAAAGPFFVYFDADEDPESQRDRPQVSHRIDALAPGEMAVIPADFTPLSSPQNNHLGWVRGMTVRVDPKSGVAESHEDDNVLVTPLPSLVGADAIQGPILRSDGHLVVVPAEPAAQTFTPQTAESLVGIEVTANYWASSGTRTLDYVLAQGTSTLATGQLVVHSTPFSGTNPPAISGAEVGTGFIDLRQSPITLVAGAEYRLSLTTTSDEIHLGLADDAVPGSLFSNDTALQVSDTPMKLFLVLAD